MTAATPSAGAERPPPTDGQPARRVTVAEWFNYLQRRLGRLEAGMNALRAGILTPMQAKQLDLAMARWDHEHPEFRDARKPERPLIEDGEASP